MVSFIQGLEDDCQLAYPSSITDACQHFVFSAKLAIDALSSDDAFLKPDASDKPVSTAESSVPSHLVTSVDECCDHLAQLEDLLHQYLSLHDAIQVSLASKPSSEDMIRDAVERSSLSLACGLLLNPHFKDESSQPRDASAPVNDMRDREALLETISQHQLLGSPQSTGSHPPTTLGFCMQGFRLPEVEDGNDWGTLEQAQRTDDSDLVGVRRAAIFLDGTGLGVDVFRCSCALTIGNQTAL